MLYVLSLHVIQFEIAWTHEKKNFNLCYNATVFKIGNHVINSLRECGENWWLKGRPWNIIFFNNKNGLTEYYNDNIKLFLRGKNRFKTWCQNFFSLLPPALQPAARWNGESIVHDIACATPIYIHRPFIRPVHRLQCSSVGPKSIGERLSCLSVWVIRTLSVPENLREQRRGEEIRRRWH